MPARGSNVVVIGGGVIGLSIARRAGASGASVTVVDPEPGAGASSVAAGMLAPITEVHYGEEALLRFNLASARMYAPWVEDLERETGLDTGYRQGGTLLVARDRDDNEALSELFSFQTSLGLEVRRLKSRDARELEPGLAPGTRGAILAPEDHLIDPQALTATLLTACEKSDVTFIKERATELVSETDRATGVAAGDRVVPADIVVLATGAAAAVGGLPFELPVRPVKGQLVHLRATGGLPLPISRSVRGLDVYLVPRSDGTLVVGATVEERTDRVPTAGAVLDLLRYGYELVPGLTELEFAGAFVGMRPGTPDNAPLIGPVTNSLYVATGHYRNGILLAPATAEAFGRWMEGEDADDDLRAFGPGRFRR